MLFNRPVYFFTQVIVVYPIVLLFLIYSFGNPNTNLDCTTNVKDKRNKSANQLKKIIFETPKEISYNLMEETYGQTWKKRQEKFMTSINCTIEYANERKLQQDHPCVINLIQKDFLRLPAYQNASYNLDRPTKVDPSSGQSLAILRLLRNQTNGFFIECGGYDGEFLSNTLFMERNLNWTGILIEADKNAFEALSTRNRKAFTSPACLSTKPYPMKVLYNATLLAFSSIVEKNSVTTHITKAAHLNATANSYTEDVYEVQCFPLYSILLALGRTDVDYFSLDVEGSEYKILATIPWNKVNFKTLTVEWEHTPEGEAAMTKLMKKNKFIKFGHIEMKYSREVVYIEDFLSDLREYE